jgi:hypothetical protein
MNIYVHGDKIGEINDSYFTWKWNLPKDEWLFYLLSISAISIAGLFIIPLVILVGVQMGNLCAGKTMLERYSKSAQATEDVAMRLVNSGIQNDSRIIEPYLQVHGKANYNDSIMLATK